MICQLARPVLGFLYRASFQHMGWKPTDVTILFVQSTVRSTRTERHRYWTNGCVNRCTNSPEDGPVGPKHVEIQQYTNKIVYWTNGCVNSCTNSPEDGPVGPKHVEIRQYTNKIVTSVGFHSIWLDQWPRNDGSMVKQCVREASWSIQTFQERPTKTWDRISTSMKTHQPKTEPRIDQSVMYAFGYGEQHLNTTGNVRIRWHCGAFA